MSRRASLGFDRRIDLEWLDAAAAQARPGATSAEMRAYLWNLLDGLVSGDKSNSARGKTVTVLHHIWGESDRDAEALRQRALAQLPKSTSDERLALHWAMMVARYPVFTDVAAAAGRLLTLQGAFTLAHLTRRLVAAWGERSTVERAAQRIIRSMVQWRVLTDMATPGIYAGKPHPRKVGPETGMLLVEALLLDSEEQSVPVGQLIGHPAFFPFAVDVNAGHVRSAAQFRVHRQGLDSDFVELRLGRDVGVR
ncbi:hypothetical protein [Thiococcus pfennigii]|uniref:hypothetical protein n=1 Tax=Thiococcus pfennigii TaxID=1057 RepID=UPI0019040FBB|nr:hypothetical protein [Thiococcus pfennigii]MBK1702256.1 hypothetical protein [Thiococcus pfennigii]